MLYMVGDFETTVTGEKDQNETEVWASAIVEFFTEDVIIFHSITDTFKYLEELNESIILYYHNLKFDGQFIIDYLIRNTDYEQAFLPNKESNNYKFKQKYHMERKTFKYSISDIGQWYSIVIRTYRGKIIEIRDSVKLLPFSVKEIGKAFNTKHQKLTMEYTGNRYAGCNITDEEKEYIANDVLVVKEALEIMYKEGHSKLTIGSCCLSEFKKLYDRKDYDMFFPDLYSHYLCEYKNANHMHDYGSETIGEYIRNSYKGGWCYLVPEKSQKIYHNGITADVNSLYPSMMHSESGNKYPIGLPQFFEGAIPERAYADNIYFFVRIKTKFKLKKGKLPCIQIKKNHLYKGTEWLTTSQAYYKGQYYDYYEDIDGNIVEVKPVLTLTCIDYKLICEHYDLIDCEILDGCMFYTTIGLFDEYIDHYKEIKLKSKGALRTLAKLFLNNLYGKMAASTDSSFKIAFMSDDELVKYKPITAYDKKAGYIPVGSAITSYARNFTIRTAQKNYYGSDKRGFIYADTDSIHCDLKPEELKGVKVHNTNFCCWALECSWDKAFFSKQKTYIEHVIAEDLQECEPYYSIKAAGMSQKSKNLFIRAIENKELTEEEKEKYTNAEQIFIESGYTITDFKTGLIIPSGRLRPKRVKGGIVLVESEHEMRG